MGAHATAGFFLEDVRAVVIIRTALLGALLHPVALDRPEEFAIAGEIGRFFCAHGRVPEAEVIQTHDPELGAMAPIPRPLGRQAEIAPERGKGSTPQPTFQDRDLLLGTFARPSGTPAHAAS